MTYKYLNDNGLKALVKKIKGANKDLNTPIAISKNNTPENQAQNTKNIADFVARAKAAGITDVNGMAVTCLINDDYSGMGYLYVSEGTYICGISTFEDESNPEVFSVDLNGQYLGVKLINEKAENVVTSSMLNSGARKPIILTPKTIEVDEETYQKLLNDDVDVVYKNDSDNICLLTYKLLPVETETGNLELFFTCFSCEQSSMDAVYLYGYRGVIKSSTPHEVEVTVFLEGLFKDFLEDGGLLFRYKLASVLKNIDLTGTDANRKARLAQFEKDWKALTGATDLLGARFIGYNNDDESTVLFIYDSSYSGYRGLSSLNRGYGPIEYSINNQGSIVETPYFSHLAPVEIFKDNSAESMQKNLNNLNAYKANLKQLKLQTSRGFQVPFITEDNRHMGTLHYTIDSDMYVGISASSAERFIAFVEIDATTGEYQYYDITQTGDIDKLIGAVGAFGAIELKANDNASNKTAIAAYRKRLIDAYANITNGYSVPVRITGNSQEYHGMLNIGTGTLLSGIVTDVNESHHYPFNVSTADGAILFDENNYFLEKTSNEVTEMLDAIKYSYTPVPLTATTLSNKAQLEVFISKVPNAQVMHCTYKDVYAGTLHKINGDWFGLLVKNTNNYEDALQVKLQADGTLIEGTTSLAQVNAKLNQIIG